MKLKSKMVTLAVLVSLIATSFLTSGFAFVTASREVLPIGPDLQTVEFPFTDVKGHWAEPAIIEMYAKGVMKGYQDSSFRPRQFVTFLEAVVLLDKLLGYEPSDSDADSANYLSQYFNVPQWAAGYVSVALKRDLLVYSDLAKMSLQQPLIRQNAAFLSVRAMGLIKQAKYANIANLSYSDLSKLDNATKAVIAITCDHKIMNGFPNGTFQPSSPLSRAEMAVILSNLASQVPGGNKDQVSGYITSVNSLSSSVSIDDNGKEIKFELPPKYLIYSDFKAALLSRLVTGEYLSIICNEAVDLTVLIASSVSPSEGIPVSIEPVNITLAPETILQWVGSNKIVENYLIKKLDGSIYLLVTRGEKMTGGYNVDIRKVTSFKGDSGNVNYRVWVERTDPTEGDLVNQVISYPYSLVKSEAPQNAVGTVTFVDGFNQKLAEIQP